MRYQTTVSNIVHRGGQVIPAVAFGDKGTQLDILEGHFFATDTPGQDFFQFLVIGMMSQSLSQMCIRDRPKRTPEDKEKAAKVIEVK